MTKAKNMKVYRVVFYNFVKDGKESGDYVDFIKFNVLGEDVEEAIFSAKESLKVSSVTKKEQKTCYVGEVELITILD